MKTVDLLSMLDGVRNRGAGRWSARCPVHVPDKHPSLSIMEGDRGLLVKCWAGCTLEEITNKLGLPVSDLFFDAFDIDPRHRHENTQRRAEKRAAQAAAYEAEGRRLDLEREAEHLIRSAQWIDILSWSPERLDKALNRLADAYHILGVDNG